jgi:hypothetical protein
MINNHDHPLATLSNQRASGLLVVNGAKTNLTFYFAGKIGHHDWRHSMVHDLRDAAFYNDDLAFCERPILQNALGEGLHYSGPHFNSCDHGCAHGPNQHGVLDSCIEQMVPPRSHVSEAALLQIRRADVLFAWLDDPTCYGSLVEIGIARALHKMIWIGWSASMATIRDSGHGAPKDDLWFANSLADYSCVANSAEQSFRYFLAKSRRHDRF